MTGEQVTTEVLRTLLGKRVKLELTWDAPTRRRGITQRRTERIVGVVVRDDRTTGERYLLRKTSQAHVISTTDGWRVARIYEEVAR